VCKPYTLAKKNSRLDDMRYRAYNQKKKRKSESNNRRGHTKSKVGTELICTIGNRKGWSGCSACDSEVNPISRDPCRQPLFESLADCVLDHVRAFLMANLPQNENVVEVRLVVVVGRWISGPTMLGIREGGAAEGRPRVPACTDRQWCLRWSDSGPRMLKDWRR
jgi:hypothetical protein